MQETFRKDQAQEISTRSPAETLCYSLEAQRAQETCLGSHSWSVIEAGAQPRWSDPRAAPVKILGTPGF